MKKGDRGWHFSSGKKENLAETWVVTGRKYQPERHIWGLLWVKHLQKQKTSDISSIFRLSQFKMKMLFIAVNTQSETSTSHWGLHKSAWQTSHPGKPQETGHLCTQNKPLTAFYSNLKTYTARCFGQHPMPWFISLCCLTHTAFWSPTNTRQHMVVVPRHTLTPWQSSPQGSEGQVFLGARIDAQCTLRLCSAFSPLLCTLKRKRVLLHPKNQQWPSVMSLIPSAFGLQASSGIFRWMMNRCLGALCSQIQHKFLWIANMHIKKLRKIFKGQNTVSWDFSTAKALPDVPFFYSVYLFFSQLKGKKWKTWTRNLGESQKLSEKTQTDLLPFSARSGLEIQESSRQWK